MILLCFTNCKTEKHDLNPITKGANDLFQSFTQFFRYVLRTTLPHTHSHIFELFIISLNLSSFIPMPKTSIVRYAPVGEHFCILANVSHVKEQPRNVPPTAESLPIFQAAIKAIRPSHSMNLDCPWQLFQFNFQTISSASCVTIAHPHPGSGRSSGRLSLGKVLLKQNRRIQ